MYDVAQIVAIDIIINRNQECGINVDISIGRRVRNRWKCYNAFYTCLIRLINL